MFSGKFRWWWGYGPEATPLEYAYPTKEEAIAAAIAAGQERGLPKMVIAEGRWTPLDDDIFDADLVLAHWHERNFQHAGPDGDLSMEPTDDQKTLLESVLRTAFVEWRIHNLLGRPRTWEIKETEIIDVPAPPPVIEPPVIGVPLPKPEELEKVL